MLDGFDNGRSRSFYCRAAALLVPQDSKSALRTAGRKTAAPGFYPQDPKARAKLLRSLLTDGARQAG